MDAHCLIQRKPASRYLIRTMSRASGWLIIPATPASRPSAPHSFAAMADVLVIGLPDERWATNFASNHPEI